MLRQGAAQLSRSRAPLIARPLPFSLSLSLSPSSRLPSTPPPALYLPQSHARAHARWASSSSGSPPPSQTAPGYRDFYKTFTRPVSKVLLMALFTYQLVYWAWAKLEQDEVKDGRRAEIAELEAQVRALQAEQEEKEKQKQK